MKYRWEILWSDGHKDRCLYAVERKYAERVVLKLIKQNRGYMHLEAEEIRFIPEEG